MSLGAEKIVSLLLDSLSIEELEAALARKKEFTTKIDAPKKTNRQRLKEDYRKRLLALGALYPP